MHTLKVETLLKRHMTLHDIKQIITDYDEYLDSQFSTNPIGDTLKSRARFFDYLLQYLWNKSGLTHNSDISLNAIGGFGRQVLHPHSDIDIFIIHDESVSSKDQDAIQQFLISIWDMGLNLGHGVSTLKQSFDLCKEDLKQATSMMEIRPLCGTFVHSKKITEKLFSDDIYDSRQFFKGKLEEQQLRHLKSGKTAYSLEPNIKNSPGGLRDIQTLNWVACKHFATIDPQVLKKVGFFSQDEYSELIECQHFLWRIRWALHQVAGRSENRLLIGYQSDVAKRMGFGGEGNPPIEKMMRQLFRAKKRIRELNRMLMSHLERNILTSQKHCAKHIINDEFEVVDGYIQARNQDVFIEFKQILIMFRLIAMHSNKVKGIAPETLRLLRQVRRRLLGDLQDYQDCRTEFIALFKHHEGMGLSLTLMHQYGILAAYLPQWREVVGQMQFDLFHAYTVDEHTYRLLKCLYSFEKKKEDPSLNNVANLYRQMANRDSLLFAALFHDLAKGRGGDHSELGAVDAEHFATFHNLKISQTKTIIWLVEYHLLMTSTSQRMDIYNPDVVTAFAKQVKTEVRLDALYCLTVADIQATNNNLWSDWKATLLNDLYTSTKQALRNGLENMLEVRSLVRERKIEALENRDTNKDQISDEDTKNLWKRLPISFFSNAEPSEIMRYTEAIWQYHQDKDQKTSPLLLIDKNEDKGCSNLFVYTKDKPGLFVSLFNGLANLRISVRQAQITITKDDYVIELLKITDYDHFPIKTTTRKQQVLDRLKQILIGDENHNYRYSNQRKQERRAKVFNHSPSIEYLQTRQTDRTLLSVSALETPEFMGRIAESFRALNLNIHSAKISTIGERVDNVFAISNNEGLKLTMDEQKNLNALLIDTINPD